MVIIGVDDVAGGAVAVRSGAFFPLPVLDL